MSCFSAPPPNPDLRQVSLSCLLTPSLSAEGLLFLGRWGAGAWSLGLHARQAGSARVTAPRAGDRRGVGGQTASPCFGAMARAHAHLPGRPTRTERQLSTGAPGRAADPLLTTFPAPSQLPPPCRCFPGSPPFECPVSGAASKETQLRHVAARLKAVCVWHHSGSFTNPQHDPHVRAQPSRGDQGFSWPRLAFPPSCALCSETDSAPGEGRAALAPGIAPVSAQSRSSAAD